MDSYNAMIYFTGEGYINVFLPKVGETVIYAGRPIYLKNMSFDVLNSIRSLRPLRIDLKITNSSKGAYQTIDFSSYTNLKEQIKNTVTSQPKLAPVSNEELSSIFSKGTKGPIPLEECKSNTTDNTELLKDTSNKPNQEQNTVNPGYYIVDSGTHFGKTIQQVFEEGKLDAVYKRTKNQKLKTAIEEYYKFLKG